MVSRKELMGVEGFIQGLERERERFGENLIGFK